ncbi:DUF2730 domain-containing protein [Histophilus somni]|uniref:DUF2730 family protein n=1 Tax=Histophilus somni TaxID=731 RepID=UPI00094B3113|nr:DUF2730 family protein [Histophilus somni]THA21148.1 DUF2730 domain-containing protein [Histophilus somni]
MLDIISFIQKYWQILMTILGLVVTLFWLKADSKYAKKSDLAAVRSDVQANEHRVTTLENRLDSLPTTEDVANLKVLMTEIKGETKATTAELKALSHQVGLLIEAKVLGKE